MLNVTNFAIMVAIKIPFNPIIFPKTIDSIIFITEASNGIIFACLNIPNEVLYWDGI